MTSPDPLGQGRAETAAYVNGLLCDLEAGRRSKAAVTARLLRVFPCLKQEDINDRVHRGMRLAVEGGRLVWTNVAIKLPP